MTSQENHMTVDDSAPFDLAVETPSTAVPVKPGSTKEAKAEVKPTHAVIYTDGGCRPASRGIGGWGIHGYFFTTEPAKQGTGNGSALPTPEGYKMGASGKPDISITHYVDGIGSLLPESTNNIAELVAAQKAFEVCKTMGVKDIVLRMDSKYVIQGIEDWMRGWAANDWIKGDFQPVANAEYWKQIHQTKKELDAAGVNLRCLWIKGHSNELGNDAADRNATRGVIAGHNGLTMEDIRFSDGKGYWTAKTSRSRLFSHPNWYFGTQNNDGVLAEDGRHIYYIGDPREDVELLGKKISNATFAVLYLREPEPVLTHVRTATAKLGDGRYQGLMIGHLNELFKPTVYNEIEKFGDALVRRDVQRQRLFAPSDEMVVQEVSPPRLAYQAIDALQALELLLQQHLFPKPNSRVRSTDITALLYESDSASKKPAVKLKPHITGTYRSMDVQAGYATGADGTGVTKLVLTLGLDLPDRNTLAALAGENTKVVVVTWPVSEHAIRFATVIEADGDAGIWSGIYANLHMLAT